MLIEAAKRLSLPKGALKNGVYVDRQGELTPGVKCQKPLS
jgi:transposase